MSDHRPTREECEGIIKRCGHKEFIYNLALDCIRLLDENANLKRDKERLDWLEKNLVLQVSHVKLDKDLAQIGVEIIFGPTGTMVEQDTLREAIDAAMEFTASEGEPKA